MNYLVNEIYPCLQGEGVSLGRPSLLVRFQICNLRCTWCDTPYTHTHRSDPRDPKAPELGQNWKRHSLVELVQRCQQHQERHAILTGGEPTLHNLAAFKKALGSEWTAEVETNGTRIPHRDLVGFDEADYHLFQWNVSPKGRNAGEEWVPEALSHWAQLAHKHPQVWFKFVVRQDKKSEDIAEVQCFLDTFKPPKQRILLMPEGTDLDSQVGCVWLHDLCLDKGFRYSPRLHVLLFGPRRGV